MAEPMVCMKCGGNTNSHIFPCQCKPAADPAQSAPSAERFDPEKFLYERLGFAFKAQNSSLTVTVFKPIQVMSLSQSDGKWDVVYLMDKAWDLLVELAADKQAAALRTAQLEQDLSDVMAGQNLALDEGLKLLTRAETAESALREARELAIKECAEICDNRVKQLTSHTDKYPEGGLAVNAKAQRHEAKVIAEEIRALLTVAAQTPVESTKAAVE